MEKEEQSPIIDKAGQTMQKFEVRMTKYSDGRSEKHIFIDGELFDWGVDKASLEKMHKMGPEYFAAAQKDIQAHFIDSLSEFLGRKVNEAQVIQAHIKGWI